MDKNFLPQNVWDRLDLGPQLWPTKRPSAMWIYAINCFVNKANAKEPPLLSWAVGQMVWWGKSQKADAAATFVLWGAMWVMHEFKWCHFIGTTCCQAPKMRNGICFSTLHGALNLHFQPASWCLLPLQLLWPANMAYAWHHFDIWQRKWNIPASWASVFIKRKLFQ